LKNKCFYDARVKNMIVSIEKNEIESKVKAPSSKSYTHRALLCSALANGKSKIISPLISDDIEATLDVLKNIGIKIEKGKYWEVTGNTLSKPKEDLFCKNSGTTLRFMTALCSIIKGECKLTGGSSLSQRPIKPLVVALKQLGVKCSCNGDFPPVIVNNNFVGGKTELPGNISSQFVSALLFISPLAKKEVTIKLTTELESKPYVIMTMNTQRKFGIEVNASPNLREFRIQKQNYINTNYEVESDWSSAAYILAAGILAGKTEVENLNMRSLQPDIKILDIFKKMEANIKIGKNSVTANKSELKSIKVDVSDSPDLFPILCTLCSVAKGKSEITGIKRLKIKESDRIVAMREGLTKIGVKMIENGNKVVIRGSRPKGTIIDPKNDHRIAMAFGVLGLIAKGKIKIMNAECVSKSFPDFWKIFKVSREEL